MNTINSIIALIAKKEYPYIKEFVEYHLNLGFNKIIIADNNNIDDTENYNTLLSYYINNNKVIIENYRGEYAPQLSFYNSIQFKYQYDWCAFIDTDEYITLTDNYSNINELLTTIPTQFNGIKLNWQIYGANGNIYHKEGTLIDRFPIPMPIDFKYNYPFPENYHVKSIIKGNCGYNFYSNPHTAAYINYCTPNDKLDFIPSDNMPFNSNINYQNIYIRHYYTKSLEEWIKYKQGKGRADIGNENNSYSIDNFLKYNPTIQINTEIINNINNKLTNK